MLKAVIFDMDGVLIDSEPLHARAAVLSLKEFGVDVSIDYSYGFIGSTTKHMLQTMIQDFQLDISIEELLNSNIKMTNKLHEEEGYTPIKGTKELIIDLKNHGVKLAVASSSSLESITKVTTELGIISYFDHLVSGTTVNNPKPAPDVFLKAMERLGVTPDECMIIEDSMNGVLAAASANAKCIGYINPHSGNQDLSKATVLIESFDHIGYQFIINEYNRAYDLPVLIAETNRLILRELTITDIEELYQIYQDDIVTEYLLETMDSLEDEIQKHMAYRKNIYGFYGYGFWGVFDKESNKLIGRCGIQNRMIDDVNEIELGYLIDSSYWDLGIGEECTKAVLSYAFDELLMTRIISVIDNRNLRSIKLAKKLGMHLEKEIKIDGIEYYVYVIHN